MVRESRKKKFVEETRKKKLIFGEIFLFEFECESGEVVGVKISPYSSCSIRFC